MSQHQCNTISVSVIVLSYICVCIAVKVYHILSTLTVATVFAVQYSANMAWVRVSGGFSWVEPDLKNWTSLGPWFQCSLRTQLPLSLNRSVQGQTGFFLTPDTCLCFHSRCPVVIVMQGPYYNETSRLLVVPDRLQQFDDSEI